MDGTAGNYRQILSEAEQNAQTFHTILKQYHAMIRLLDGSGVSNQSIIDSIWKKLDILADQNPTLKMYLPEKIELYNDGCHGLCYAAVQHIARNRFGRY